MRQTFRGQQGIFVFPQWYTFHHAWLHASIHRATFYYSFYPTYRGGINEQWCRWIFRGLGYEPKLQDRCRSEH